MREEFRQYLAEEYRYAATKMQESSQPAKKLYYFSVLFSQAQHILNLEWDRDLALIYMMSHFAYSQMSLMIQPPALGVFPIDHAMVFGALTQAVRELSNYLDKKEDNIEELHQISGRFAEIGFAATGNGSYLYEKGLIGFSPSNEP